MGDEGQPQYQRVGDTAKCPACGVPTDPAAYRCPNCLIYFCFKCRRQVQEGEPQFQCMNQQCEQYGKLLCNACIDEVPDMRDRAHEELVEAGKNVPRLAEAAIGWAFIIIVGMVFGAGWYYGFPWWSGLLVGLILGAIVVGSLSSLNEYVPPVYRTVIDKVEVGRTKCCIACSKAVQRLNASREERRKEDEDRDDEDLDGEDLDEEDFDEEDFDEEDFDEEDFDEEDFDDDLDDEVLARVLSKSAVVALLAEATQLTNKQIGEFFDALEALTHGQLGKKGPGVFSIPGLLKLKLVRKGPKPGSPGEMIEYLVKPVHNIVRVRPLKNLNEMFNPRE